MKLFFLVVLFCISQSALGKSLVIDFSSSDMVETSDLVHNLKAQALHSPMIVDGYGAGADSKIVEVGNGRHGSFNESTYSQFGQVSGQVITLDTDEWPELHLIEFNLADGWTLRPIGSQPLKIFSHGDVVINGQINCNGEAGSPARLTTPGAGGQGRCGGGQGGDGGDQAGVGLARNGSDGKIDSSATIVPGFGGQAGDPSVGGGGGGAWNAFSPLGDGDNGGGGANGGGGMNVSEPDFKSEWGGAGGGGGSVHTTDGHSGSGGGAGGGAILIRAVGSIRVGTNGRIDANGGVGGGLSDGNTGNGGAGGGGGGGSILLFSGNTLTVANNVPGEPIQAKVGEGGTNDDGAVQANGGTGRNWLAAVNYNLIGGYTPGEEFPFNPGAITFSASAQSAISKSFDLASVRATINSVTTTPISSDFSVQVAGSDDDFIADDTGFTTDFNLLKNKRYLKLKVTITNSSGNTPTFLEAINIDYSVDDINQFDFTSTTCANTQYPQSPGTTLWLLIPLLILFILRNPKFYHFN